MSEEPAKLTSAVMEKRIRPKYSGGPKRNARSATLGPMQGNREPCPACRPGSEPMAAMARASPALTVLGHGEAVLGRDDRGHLARNVHENGGGRAAVHGAVVDAGHDDDGAVRRQIERYRQQDGHGRSRTQARQNADEVPSRQPIKAKPMLVSVRAFARPASRPISMQCLWYDPALNLVLARPSALGQEQ